MCDTYEPTPEYELIRAIAAALREEFRVGVRIEEQPGWHSAADAGQVNRAFRATARCILRTLAPTDADLPGLLSGVLHRLAQRRLEAGRLDVRLIDHLLVLECHGRDDWLVFLVLTPWSEIEFLLETRGPDSDPSLP